MIQGTFFSEVLRQIENKCCVWIEGVYVSQRGWHELSHCPSQRGWPQIQHSLMTNPRWGRVSCRGTKPASMVLCQKVEPKNSDQIEGPDPGTDFANNSQSSGKMEGAAGGGAWGTRSDVLLSRVGWARDNFQDWDTPKSLWRRWPSLKLRGSHTEWPSSTCILACGHCALISSWHGEQPLQPHFFYHSILLGVEAMDRLQTFLPFYVNFLENICIFQFLLSSNLKNNRYKNMVLRTQAKNLGKIQVSVSNLLELCFLSVRWDCNPTSEDTCGDCRWWHENLTKLCYY